MFDVFVVVVVLIAVVGVVVVGAAVCCAVSAVASGADLADLQRLNGNFQFTLTLYDKLWFWAANGDKNSTKQNISSTETKRNGMERSGGGTAR